MKSHFQFSRKQRSGIFLLALIILIIQLIQLLPIDWSSDKYKEQLDLTLFQNEIDSLKQNAVKNEIKIYPFNPNYITDYKGYTLGMSVEEIDRLLAFRSKGEWINSIAHFKEVTGVSDSLLNAISPYFKFPDWVSNTTNKNFMARKFNSGEVEKPYSQKTDLNKATKSDLIAINGVGEKLSERILNFRNKHKGGFVSDIELTEIYGLSPEVIERILNVFTVKTPREILRINLNSANNEELVQVPHIDYEVAFNIIEHRTLIEGYESLGELTKVKDFPVNKLDIIKLYLFLD